MRIVDRANLTDRRRSRLNFVAVACGLLALTLGAVPTPTPQKGELKPTPKPTPKPLTVLSVTSLPNPQTKGKTSLEEALSLRRSVRAFNTEALSLAEVGQLMWAAQGITEPMRGRRTAPSAGATYPIEVFLVSRRGFGRYVVGAHSIEWYDMSDLRGALADACAKQDCVRDAPMDIVIASVPARTTPKYRDRAGRYIYLEAGHVAQNILLEATAMGLGAAPIGAFLEEQVSKVLGLPSNYFPLYVIPVGHPRPGELEAVRQGYK